MLILRIKQEQQDDTEDQLVVFNNAGYPEIAGMNVLENNILRLCIMVPVCDNDPRTG
jgi:hypothetical protein